VTAISGPYYFRIKLFHRIIHGMVIVSFLGLALTGIPLRFADTWWAGWLSRVLGGYPTTGYLHRVFAVVTFLYFGLHLGEIALRFLKGERGLFWGPYSMVPQPRDFVQLAQHVRWFLGLGPKPVFGRWTYWEKFDYWAVFWGVAVIGASGLFLWFPTFFSHLVPGWMFNVAFIVHSDEALLAVGFIFIVHFFNTHMRPEKFPMDPVIFTGRVSEAELREERPEEYAQLIREGGLEALKADPPPLWMRTFARVVGFSALAIGFFLIFLIALAVLR